MHRLIAILALLCLVTGPLVAYFELAPPLVGFGIYAVAGLLGAVAVLWGLLAALLRGRRSARAGGKSPLVSALLGLVCIAAVVVPGLGGRGYPPINDISTDLDDPPALTIAAEYPAEFVPIVREHYPDVVTLKVPGVAPLALFDQALALAQSRDSWTVPNVDKQALTFEGTAVTSLFRFRDDLIVRVRAHGDGSILDMRSRSRDGRGDLGVNATRIRAFWVDLNSRLTNPGTAAADDR